MRKIALVLALALVMSVSLCVFVSAEGNVTATPVVYYGLDDNDNINQSDETFRDEDLELTVPSDMIAVAFEFNTDGVGFAAYHFALEYDATKFQILGFDEDTEALTADATDKYMVCGTDEIEYIGGDIAGRKAPVLTGGAHNKNIKDGGRVTYVGAKLDGKNFKDGRKNLTSGTAFIVYLEVITKEACDTEITASYIEVASEDKVKYVGTGESVTVKLNGGAPVAEPVTVGVNYNYKYDVTKTLSSWKLGATLGDINSVKNHNYWAFAVLAWDAEAGVYKVSKVCPFQSEGDYRYLEIPEYGFLLGAHGNFADDCAAIAKLNVGDTVYIYGDDLLNTEIGTESNAVVTTVADESKTAFAPDTSKPEPIKSLGAKVRDTDKAIRFGAQYTKVEANGVVNALGMLLLPKAKLGNNTLDLDYAKTNDLVADVQAKGVYSGYVADKAFEDYETFVFCVTLTGLDGHEDAEIVAVPYIAYDGGEVVYADALVRSYNYVSENQPIWE